MKALLGDSMPATCGVCGHLADALSRLGVTGAGARAAMRFSMRGLRALPQRSGSSTPPSTTCANCTGSLSTARKIKETAGRPRPLPRVDNCRMGQQ